MKETEDNTSRGRRVHLLIYVTKHVVVWIAIGTTTTRDNLNKHFQGINTPVFLFPSMTAQVDTCDHWGTPFLFHLYRVIFCFVNVSVQSNVGELGNIFNSFWLDTNDSTVPSCFPTPCEHHSDPSHSVLETVAHRVDLCCCIRLSLFVFIFLAIVYRFNSYRMSVRKKLCKKVVSLLCDKDHVFFTIVSPWKSARPVPASTSQF